MSNLNSLLNQIVRGTQYWKISEYLVTKNQSIYEPLTLGIQLQTYKWVIVNKLLLTASSILNKGVKFFYYFYAYSLSIQSINIHIIPIIINFISLNRFILSFSY